jgi:hypothetical protein
MLTTKNLVSEVKDVPAVWVFSHYANVPIETFDGTEFKINSVFNDKDRTPSMSFWVNADDNYRFNDFSTGNKGDHIDLVKLKFDMGFADACQKIISDYNSDRLKSNGEMLSIREFKQHSKYKVTDHVKRKWNQLDAKQWTPYNIGSKLLERFYVFPLSSYTMAKDDKQLDITGDHIYGYFKKDGTLYKIYQPKATEHKFIKISDYIQGSEQVLGRPFLIYTSSLKDIMSVESLGLNCDLKAPDSENTLISESVIKRDKAAYKKILVLFDNDTAGQKAAKKYKDKYDIEPIFLNYGQKDPSDHVKSFGPRKTKLWLVPIIDRKLNYA